MVYTALNLYCKDNQNGRKALCVQSAVGPFANAIIYPICNIKTFTYLKKEKKKKQIIDQEVVFKF